MRFFPSGHNSDDPDILRKKTELKEQKNQPSFGMGTFYGGGHGYGGTWGNGDGYGRGYRLYPYSLIQYWN